MTPAQLRTLRSPWPVERPDDQAQPEDVCALIASGLLYREPVGHGWVRIGLTDAGRDALARDRAVRA